MARPRGRGKHQGQVAVFTAAGGQGLGPDAFGFRPGLGSWGGGWVRVPSQTLLVSVRFALLGEEIAAFALGSGVCAGVRGGLGEVLFHPTWFDLFVTVLLTKVNEIVPYIYIYIYYI